MSFYDRYKELCNEHGFTPNTQQSFDITGQSTGTISGWNKGRSPSMEAICRISKYFKVTSDYLLGLSDLRNSLSEEEQLLVNAYRSANPEGRFRIIQTCMNEQDKGKASAAI